jgi:hypothetical protein
VGDKLISMYVHRSDCKVRFTSGRNFDELVSEVKVNSVRNERDFVTPKKLVMQFDGMRAFSTKV